MKRIAMVSAYDGVVRVSVKAEVTTGSSLTKGEADALRRDLTSALADALRGLRYADFGPHNIRAAR